MRGLRTHPAHALTAIVTLAIGIGANVAMFAVVDAVLLAPLDYRDADRLVAVTETPAERRRRHHGLSLVCGPGGPRPQRVTDLVAATQSTATFDATGRDAVRVNAMRVSRAWFDLVGVQPVLGRAFTAAEDRPGPGAPGGRAERRRCGGGSSMPIRRSSGGSWPLAARRSPWSA